MSDTPKSPNATVVGRNDLNAELAIVHVAPDGWNPPDFEPGQFATLGLPDPEKRSGLLKRVFSIASAPGAPAMEFYIQLVKHGEFTRRLWHLEEGDRLWLSDKVAGRFTLEPVPPDKDLLLLGTGTGLAPYLSMVRHYRGRERWRRAAVVHGVRHVADLGYREELERLAAEDESLAYVPLVSRDPEWTGVRGRVQLLLEDGALEARTGFPLDPTTCHVFLCGSPAMIDDMEVALAALGFTAHSGRAPGNLHFERYW